MPGRRRPPSRLPLTRGRAALRGGLGIARALAVARLGRAHPIISGALPAPGASTLIEVVRDRFGVPHVRAASERDAMYGQGFVHAQDRLAQADLIRRLAAGRLAEVAGRPLLESDRFWRRLGLVDRAGRDLRAMAEAERALLVAYAEGFNAGVRSLPALPPEYALLGSTPEPWDPLHCLLIGRFVMFTFTTNWDTELVRERLVRALGPERAAMVDPVNRTPEQPVIGTPYAATAERLLAALRVAFDGPSPGSRHGGASNAWAIAGSRTASGAPLLAGDPHLQARLPNLFHVAHLAGGELDVIGAGVPGLPGVMIGHGAHVAWSLTAGLADTADCYIEALDPDDATRYLTPDGWTRGRVRIERIAVRDELTVEEQVLETRHGPVIGPSVSGEHRAIVLRATALEPGETIGPLLALNRATSTAEFDRAVQRWPGATFNFVFAGTDGHIGYRLAGQVPRRSPGEGLLPRMGATSAGPPDCWSGHQLPGIADPPVGYIVSANQTPGGNLELGEEFCESWRADRIARLLAMHDAHTVGDQQSIQLDQHSEPLWQIRQLLLEHRVIANPAVAGIIETWDGQVSAGSAAGAILETVYQELARTLATRLAGSQSSLALGAGVVPALPSSSFGYRLTGWVLRMLDTPSPACPDAAARDRLLEVSTTAALGRLEQQLGPRPEQWQWGRLHLLRLGHLLGDVPVAGSRFSRGPYPMGGDVNTVWQGGYSVRREPVASGFVPAYRQVIDLADFDRSTFLLLGGNSGIPGHERYDDMIDEYFAGEQRPLLYSAAAIDRHAEHSLRLEPA